MNLIDREELILERMKENGCRITEQRKLLIHIILENECSSCKEIYYKALKKDATVGIATVYRMVRTLEDFELINRKNLYNISYENLNLNQENEVVLVKKNNNVVAVPKGEWYDSMIQTLKEQDLIEDETVVVTIKEGQEAKKEDYCCTCDNISCGYHR